MSSPLKSFIVASLLLLTACGFTPMYGQTGGENKTSATHQLNNVEIAMIPNESGVYLRNILIDRFYQDGYPASPSYTLAVARVDEVELDLDITQDSETTRKQLRLTTTLVLTDNETRKPVLRRSLTAITSYNVLGSQFTTRVSGADAREAALSDLARQIELQTALYFKR